MLGYPDDLYYTVRHVWLRPDKQNEDTATVGLTEDRLERTPPLLSIDMPMLGDELEIDTDCCHLHLATGAIQIVRAPLGGRVVEINRDVLDNPELLHMGPFENWIFRMEYDSEDEFEILMNAKQYMHFLDQMDV